MASLRRSTAVCMSFIRNGSASSESWGRKKRRASAADDRLSLTANYGYTHAAFRNYDMGQGSDGVHVDYTGNRVPFVPAHTASIAADTSPVWAPFV